MDSTCCHLNQIWLDESQEKTKSFQQCGSRSPGHPENFDTPGLRLLQAIKNQLRRSKVIVEMSPDTTLWCLRMYTWKKRLSLLMLFGNCLVFLLTCPMVTLAHLRRAILATRLLCSMLRMNQM